MTAIPMRAHALVVAALLLLSACATPFQSRVSRFQEMPAPSGQSFVIQPADSAKSGSLEFEQYAGLVRQNLISQGYAPAPSPSAATLVVELDYGVNNGREKIDTRPGTGMYGPWGPWGWSPYYGRYWGRGWYDPFWGPWGWGGWDQPEVYSYTVYNSFLNMRIMRTGNGQRVFEGRAEAQTRSDDLTTLVPNLVQAMFTNFPGNSGETVKVKIPPPAKGK